MTRAEAIAPLRSCLEVALVAERRPCPACCLAMFPRLHHDGVDMWRPGLVWSRTMRSWVDAVRAWLNRPDPSAG